MLTSCSEFPNRNVRTFGFVYHDTNGPNHGPVWKTQSCLLSEICTVILWQDQYGKGNLRKYYWSTVGRKFQIGNVSLYIIIKGLFLSVHVDDITLVGKKQNIDPMWNVLNKEVEFGRTNIFPWSCIIGMYSTTMWNKQRYCWQSQNHVRIANFAGGAEKYHARKNFTSLRCLTIWRVMPRNVWNGIVSWKTARLNNPTEYLLHATMTITSKKKKMKSVV